MTASWPAKADYATGDVLSATNMNDLAGVVNFMNPTGTTNGYVLTADSTVGGKVKWAAGGGGGSGKLLQAVTSTLATTASTTSTTFTDTGLSASITPSATTSKILILATINVGVTGSASSVYSLFRDSTNLLSPTSPSNRTPGFLQYPGDITGSDYFMFPATINWYDSPSSTSSLTYKLSYKISSGGTAYINRTSADGDNAVYARGVSSITLLEIGA